MFRLDRKEKTSKCTRGGGVTVLVNTNYEAELLNVQSDSVELQYKLLIMWGKIINV